MMQTMQTTIPIETRRLTLRAFDAGDFDAVWSYRSRADVARFLYWKANDRHAVRAALERKIAATSIEAEGDVLALAVVVRNSGVLVGDVILQLVSDEHRQGEIGYIVHPDHAGNGYATEAVRPLLRIAFEDLGLHRVVGRLDARNAASARVLEKLGLRLEAHLVENEWVKGEWQSELVYATLDREWRAQG